jgi:hypothetical protein
LLLGLGLGLRLGPEELEAGFQQHQLTALLDQAAQEDGSALVGGELAGALTLARICWTPS